MKYMLKLFSVLFGSQLFSCNKNRPIISIRVSAFDFIKTLINYIVLTYRLFKTGITMTLVTTEIKVECETPQYTRVARYIRNVS